MPQTFGIDIQPIGVAKYTQEKLNPLDSADLARFFNMGQQKKEADQKDAVLKSQALIQTNTLLKDLEMLPKQSKYYEEQLSPVYTALQKGVKTPEEALEVQSKLLGILSNPQTMQYMKETKTFKDHQKFLEDNFTKMGVEDRKRYGEDLQLRATDPSQSVFDFNPSSYLGISGDEKVSNMIEALSTMLSAATARGGETMISLAEELTYVNAYLYIISVRFGKRLSVKQEIDETLLGEKVPRLVMQPIVENAIEHGIAPHRNGDLILRIYRQEEKIVMEVENSGELTDSDKEAVDRLLNWDGNDTKEIKPGRLGIRNVNLRLKFLYGKECGLTITSLPNQRTLARIILLNQSNSSVSLYNPDNQTKLYK